MDFGETLKRWDSSRRSRKAPRLDMEAALERYPPDPGARAIEPSEERRVSRPRAPLAPQAELDLHGLSAAEAEEAIERFLGDARERGLSTVLLIHGKGNHSPGQPVLEGVVRRYLESCPFTGAFGRADRARGGKGATWVRIRPRA
jgi:DNA-nicking Smr family endonuclease